MANPWAVTSKYPPREDWHGKQGSFLASLGALSLLTITSRHQSYPSQNSLKIHNGALIARDVPVHPEQRILKCRHGTKITVRNLFGSMPVRVKQRPVAGDRTTVRRDWDRLVRNVVALVLAWPNSVSVTIHDEFLGQSVTLRAGNEISSAGSVPDQSSDRDHRVPRTLSQAGLLEDVDFGSWVPVAAAAGPIAISGCVSLTPSATKRNQFISIGIHPILSEHGQNILTDEINNVFANSWFGTEDADDDVYDGKLPKNPREGPQRRELKIQKGIERWPQYYIRIQIAERTEHTGVSVVDDILDERHVSLKVIISLLQRMFFEFLRKHSFRPRQVGGLFGNATEGQSRSQSRSQSLPAESIPISDSENGARRETEQHNRSDTKPRSKGTMHSRARPSLRSDKGAGPGIVRHDHGAPTSLFDSWARVKSSSSHSEEDKRGENCCTVGSAAGIHSAVSHGTATAEASAAPALASAIVATELPVNDISQGPISPALRGHRQDIDKESFDDVSEGATERTPMDAAAVVRENPGTKASHIDTTTGLELSTEKRATGLPIRRQNLDVPTASMTANSPARGLTGSSSSAREVVNSTMMPTAALFEPTGPRMADNMSEGSERNEQRPMSHLCAPTSVDDTSELFSASLCGRASKAALADAEIIGQVDDKFILIKLRSGAFKQPEASASSVTDSPTLVLVDQHAADERCKLESLMDGYFRYDRETGHVSAYAEALEKPMVFELSQQEGTMLMQFRDHFRYWGIVFDEAVQDPGAPKRMETRRGTVTPRIRVQCLAPSILERCRTEPKLLIGLMREEAWRLHEHNDGGLQTGRTTKDGEAGSDAAAPAWVSRFHGCPRGILDLLNSRACRSRAPIHQPLMLLPWS